MLCVLLGFGLILYWAFWGLGLALWLLPAGGRRFLWAVCIPFGLALQIGVVWWLLRLAGPIATYGPWANLLPVLVLFGALLRPRNRRWLLAALSTWTFVISVGLVGLGILLALIPISLSPNNTLGLTTISIGSQDAPDYALGAGFFLENGMGTPGKYWGQIEQLKFTKYWMEYNHFGAAALLSMASTTFNVELWQLITVLTCTLGACGAPLVMAFSKRLAGMSWGLAALCGVLYSLSPLWLYGAYNNAVGQMIGTLGIACYLLFGLSLPHFPNFWGCRKWIGAGSIALWLFVSSYPMMMYFVGAIIGSWGLWRAMQLRQWISLVGVALWSAGTVALCTLIFPSRLLGLVNVSLEYAGNLAGWPIDPMLLPTILGLGVNQALEPQSFSVHLWLFGIMSTLWAIGVVMAWRIRDRAISVVIPVCGVIFCATYLMAAKDPEDRLLNSYKIYKLVAVFLPLLLPSLLFGIKASLNGKFQALSSALLALIIITYLPRSINAMVSEARMMPLHMTPGLVALQSLEKDPAIPSVNFTNVAPWDMLWATVFLQNKELHYSNNGFFGYAASPLTGEWTFERILGRSLYPSSAHMLGDGLILRRADEPALLALDWGVGWWNDERSHRWSGRGGRIFSFVLKAVHPMVGVNLSIDGEFLVPGVGVHAFIGKRELPLHLSSRGVILVKNIELEAGPNEILFISDKRAIVSSTLEDPRTLLYKVRGVEIETTQDVPVR